MVRGKRQSKKRKVINNVTAESIIRSNIDSLKKNYNASPLKKRKCSGVSGLNSGNDLALIAELFGVKSKDTKILTPQMMNSLNGSQTEKTQSSILSNDPRMSMLFLDQNDLTVPRKKGDMVLNRKKVSNRERASNWDCPD